MLLPAVLLCVVTFVCGLDPNLWTPYDKNVISAIPNSQFRVLEVSYTLEPFIIYINGYGDTAQGFSPESIENLFSVYHNYTEYNYIERVQAVVVSDKNDLSNLSLRSDVVLADDTVAPAYYFRKIGSCLPQDVNAAVMDNSGYSLCGTLDGGENCMNPHSGNYALYSSSTSSVTGYSFASGCGAENALSLTVYLAPDMFFTGTYGQSCSSGMWIDCATQSQITGSCEINNDPEIYGTPESPVMGNVLPYNFIYPYYANDEIAGDGIYNNAGYCEKSTSGECFVPTWN